MQMRDAVDGMLTEIAKTMAYEHAHQAQRWMTSFSCRLLPWRLLAGSGMCARDCISQIPAAHPQLHPKSFFKKENI
jgi:hypothetical protein